MTRNVLVTGGGAGIGRAIAERFAGSGDTVVITGRDASRLGQAASELSVHGIVCDATDAAQVAALRGSLDERIGPTLDVVVNNAGGNTDFVTADDDDGLKGLAERWRANLDANLLSAVLTTMALADRLACGGSVISIGTIGAERGGGSYGAAKAALAAWNADLSSEIGPRGITANVISAGYIEGTGFFRGRMTQQRREALIAAAHDRRPGQPGDIAQTAYFLASPGARHITGQTIHVNGGAFTTR